MVIFGEGRHMCNKQFYNFTGFFFTVFLCTFVSVLFCNNFLFICSVHSLFNQDSV